MENYNFILNSRKSFYIYFLLHVWKKKDVAESMRATLILGKIEENLQWNRVPILTSPFSAFDSL